MSSILISLGIIYITTTAAVLSVTTTNTFLASVVIAFVFIFLVRPLFFSPFFFCSQSIAFGCQGISDSLELLAPLSGLVIVGRIAEHMIDDIYLFVQELVVIQQVINLCGGNVVFFARLRAWHGR